MMRYFQNYLIITVLAFCCLGPQIVVSAATLLQDEELEALNLVTQKMGASGWRFSNGTDACRSVMDQSTGGHRNITCNCPQNSTCHIVSLEIKNYSLPGQLPTELDQLSSLQSIDFAYNYLNGSIPQQWASIQLKSISLLVNRLSGVIPRYLENFTSLTYLNLEANQFSGQVPQELGKLVNLKSLILSSNNLSGSLPEELAELKNLTDLRISDNNFNGSIPDFLGNWQKLSRLEIQASGLDGPIPPSISLLKNLTDLRISDINGPAQVFPNLSSITGLKRLVLRCCNISGEIPSYIWNMSDLITLDLSFNNLSGKLPASIKTTELRFLFLTHNMISGDIPLFDDKRIDADLSYNNFTNQAPAVSACQQTRGMNLNLFRSSSMQNDLGGACMDDLKCDEYWHDLYINSGGYSVELDGNTYEGDAEYGGGAAGFYRNDRNNWGFSSTGDFMGDSDDRNLASNIITSSSASSSNLSGLYQTGRLSPLSLTYYRYCVMNGSYNVTLYFAEIMFTNDKLYNSLGRRIFDIYIQDKLVEKDFNIETNASGVLIPVKITYPANVSNGILEIRFYWAGKGTTRIPRIGQYGSLISAISAVHLNSEGNKTKVVAIVIGVTGSCLILFLLAGVFWWRRRSNTKNKRRKDFEGLESQIATFTLKQIKASTNNFDSSNKIGEGGFGPVYKGSLPDGTVIAVKQLSSKSSQGNREFLNEISMISHLQHPNLVKIYGCCIEGDQLLLVYEYLENNSLARALFGREYERMKLDWRTRQKICVGIAKGLAFLHEESSLRVVHRDIKATNVLLDTDLNPKISDFGLAKLDEEEKTHISTRIAGTIGYIAPEYALWGYLTYKADVYSYGIVALETVTGKNNMNHGPDGNYACLLEWACELQQSGNLIELVDENLGSEFNKEEAERMIKVALLCANATPSLRPTMSDVVAMLEGSITIPEATNSDENSGDLRFKLIRDNLKQNTSNSTSGINQEFESKLAISRRDSSFASTSDV